MLAIVFYSEVVAPLSLFSAVVCGIAVVTSYIFPQQRKFPNVVLVWTCLGDFVFALYMAVVWLPGPIHDEFAAKTFTNSQLCTFFLYTVWFLQQSATMLGFLLAHTLYVSLVKNVDMEANRAYYYGYLVIFWVPSLLIPLLCVGESHTNTEYCDYQWKGVTIVRTGIFVLFLLVQVFLIFKVCKVVKKITTAVQKNSTNTSNAYLWLFARCVGAQINQVIVWLPSIVREILGLWNVQLSVDYAVYSGLLLICLSLNGCIVLAGNKPLRSSLSTLFCFCKTPKKSQELLRESSFSQQSVSV